MASSFDIRYGGICDLDLVNFVTDQENHSPRKKTSSDVTLFKQYLREVTQARENFEELPPAELDRHIASFIINIRWQDGQEYEPSTLRGLFSSIDRYLKQCQYDCALMESREFSSARVCFGMRGGTEHRDLKWGDVVLKSNDAGREYLQYNERQTKTRTGANPRDVRPIAPRNLDRCPVEAYKRYRATRPQEMNDAEAPFYLGINWAQQNTVAFKSQPMGQNTLYGMLRKMVSQAWIADDRKLSNHSARKYLIQKLSDCNVAPNQIHQISGHKNVQSINNYSHLNSRQQEATSDVLVARGSSDLALPGSSGLANPGPSSVLGRPSSPPLRPPLPALPHRQKLSPDLRISGPISASPNPAAAMRYQSSQSTGSGQFVGCTFTGNVSVNYFARPAKQARVLYDSCDDSQ